MKIWNDISKFKAKNPVITIGSFDGVHLGHMQVISQLKRIANSINGETVVFTFSPHPARVLAPEKNFVLLTTIEEKTELFEKAGIDHLIVFPFTLEFAKLTYLEFVVSVLIKQLKVNTILVGYDNKIGRNREGNYQELIKLSETHSFNVEQQEKLMLDENELSSTNIRSLLNNGKLLQASNLLGYPYMVSGIVVHGQHLGNKLGFPTANILPPENKFIPANGVYAITINYNEQNYLGMMNIGIRPTLEDYATTPVIEAHLFDFNGQLYNQRIKISIIRKLRDEYKFDSVDALRAQLKKDKVFALETLHKEFGI